MLFAVNKEIKLKTEEVQEINEQNKDTYLIGTKP